MRWTSMLRVTPTRGTSPSWDASSRAPGCRGAPGLRRRNEGGRIDADYLQAPVQRVEGEGVRFLHRVVEDRVVVRIFARGNQHGRGQRDQLGETLGDASLERRVRRLL